MLLPLHGTIDAKSSALQAVSTSRA